LSVMQSRLVKCSHVHIAAMWPDMK